MPKRRERMAYHTETNYCCKNLEVANNKRKKKVAQIYEGKIIKIYDCLSDVAKDGFTFSLVGKVARGERSHHKGFEWKYV